MRQSPSPDPTTATAEAASAPSRPGDSPVPAAPEKKRAGGGDLRRPAADRRRRAALGRREEAILVSRVRCGAANGGNGRGGREQVYATNRRGCCKSQVQRERVGEKGKQSRGRGEKRGDGAGAATGSGSEWGTRRRFLFATATAWVQSNILYCTQHLLWFFSRVRGCRL
jgi:hypothetical protein